MIISSLLDLDFYKLTMAQVAWKRFRDVPVTYAFTNRTRKVRLAEVVREADLNRELDRIRGLRFGPDELDWLRESRHIKRGLFQDGFLDHLGRLRLPECQVAVEDGQFVIETSGTWPEAMLWETLILSAVNELYYKALLEKEGFSWRQPWIIGQQRLADKLALLKTRVPGVRIIEFGTRRRFSGDWQSEVVRTIAAAAPQMLVGTSNVALARRLDLPPIGTFAHEMFMVLAGRAGGDDAALRGSHNEVLRSWWDEYGEPLSIALTDTFGTDFFFRDFAPEQAAKWRGLRQDSGDPAVFGEKAIAFYRGLGIDPATKLVVFSDGLDAETIIALEEKFSGRIRTAYGWGTNLTNDCGHGPLSLVVKASRAGGRPTVKLSDNMAKAMGPAAEVERYKRVFGHVDGQNQDCVY